jgi:hypothetical protein
MTSVPLPAQAYEPQLADLLERPIYFTRRSKPLGCCLAAKILVSSCVTVTIELSG